MKDRIGLGFYGALLMTVLLGLFGLVWVYTATQRARFLPIESAIWRAHIQMIDDCDAGKMTVLGSSRANAAFVPNILGPNITNLAMSGTTPLEAFYEASKIYNCPATPKVIILSFSPWDWENSKWFWSRSTRYGLLSETDLGDAARNATAVNDTVLYHSSFGSEPPPAMKNFLYSSHFPPYDFASLLAAGTGRRRYRASATMEKETLANRGQHFIYENISICQKKDTEIPSELEDQKPTFSPRPINIAYMAKLMDLLKSRNVQVLYVAPPTSVWEQKHYSASYVREYATFIGNMQNVYSNFHVVGSMTPTENLCGFADIYHVNQAGAETFSHQVAPMITAALAH